MQPINFDEQLDKIIARDPRYHRDAYAFLRSGLDFTQKQLLKQQKAAAGKAVPVHERHVTGRELVFGLRDFALEQFGPMALTVLNEWGIHRTDDFGDIVFNMVEQGLLSKTDSDTRDEFNGVFDFEEALCSPFRPSKRPESSPIERSGNQG